MNRSIYWWVWVHTAPRKHTCVFVHYNTYKHTSIPTYTDASKHLLTRIGAYSLTQAHMSLSTQQYIHTYEYSCLDWCIQASIDTNGCIHPHTSTESQTREHRRTHAHIQTHTNTNTRTPTHTRTHTQTQAPKRTNLYRCLRIRILVHVQVGIDAIVVWDCRCSSQMSSSSHVPPLFEFATSSRWSPTADIVSNHPWLLQRGWLFIQPKWQWGYECGSLALKLEPWHATCYVLCTIVHLIAWSLSWFG